jgi:hypothetical protein
MALLYTGPPVMASKAAEQRPDPAKARVQIAPAFSLLCSGSRGEARFYGADRLCVGGESFICAELGAERETTVDQTLMRGLVTAFRVFVSGLSSV